MPVLVVEALGAPDDVAGAHQIARLDDHLLAGVGHFTGTASRSNQGAGKPTAPGRSRIFADDLLDRFVLWRKEGQSLVDPAPRFFLIQPYICHSGPPMKQP